MKRSTKVVTFPDMPWVPLARPGRDLTVAMVTHDYYDHQDADRDPNVVFPIDPLRAVPSVRRAGPEGDRGGGGAYDIGHHGPRDHPQGPGPLRGARPLPPWTPLRFSQADVLAEADSLAHGLPGRGDR